MEIEFPPLNISPCASKNISMYIWPRPGLPLSSFPMSWEGQQGKDRPRPTQERPAYFTLKENTRKDQTVNPAPSLDQPRHWVCQNNVNLFALSSVLILCLYLSSPPAILTDDSHLHMHGRCCVFTFLSSKTFINNTSQHWSILREESRK